MKSDREKLPAWWSPFRLFEWIDRQPSESRRRITQSLISGLGGGIIASIGGIVWMHKAMFAGIPKWILDFLQSSIQLQLWIFLLGLAVLFGVAWFVYWLQGKNRRIAELESSLEKLTPRTTDQILDETSQRLEAKRRQTLTKIVLLRHA